MYAYYSEKVPGTVRTDENGNPRQVKPDTVIVVYIETATKDIHWDTAWKNSRAYKIVPHFFETGSFEAGLKKGGIEKILITAGPDHFLYQLYLQPLKDIGEHQLPPKSINSNQILLKGTYKEKAFFKVTGEAVEIESFPSV